jgi:hypothetical protein
MSTSMNDPVAGRYLCVLGPLRHRVRPRTRRERGQRRAD